MEKIFRILLVTLLVTLSGCVNVSKLKVSSFQVESISPTGLRSIVGTASALVDNPSGSFSVYDVNGTVKRLGTPLGDFTLDPVTVKARTSERYSVSGQLSLSQSVSVLEILSLAQNLNADDFTVDVSFKVKPKGGAAKELQLRDVPLRRAVEMIKSGKI